MVSRRRFLMSGVAARLSAQTAATRFTVFPADSRRYPDPATELDVYRLTDPAYSSTLPAHYNRAIAKNSSFLLFTCDRTGAPHPFRIDLKTAQTKQLLETADLDGRSLTLTPDNRSFCYFA